MKLGKLTLATIIAASTLFGGTYNIDKSHSNVGFKVKHLMITNVSGKFDKFNGSFEYDEKTKKLTSLVGDIQVSSINTENEKRDAHLKSADFFDEKQYPNLTFKLSKLNEDKAYGVITIKGIAKEIVLDFDDNGSIQDPWGNTRVGLELNGKINRKDFGLNWNKALETGGVVVGEEVKLNIELQGILAK